MIETMKQDIRENIVMSFSDGEECKEVLVKIQKMDALFAENWLIRLLALAAKAGFKLPKGNSTDKSWGSLLSSLPSSPEGILVQLKDLSTPEVLTLKDDLFKNCYIVKPNSTGNGVMELQMNKTIVDGNISDPWTLLMIRKEVIKYNFHFLWNEIRSLLNQKVPEQEQSVPQMPVE